MNSTTTPPPTLLASEDMEQEITRLRAEVEQLRAQLAAGGSCQCGDDDVCVIVQEWDAARASIRELEEALRETHDALERLDAIYASEHDPDPVLGTVLRPAWLADALHHARALLPASGRSVERCPHAAPDEHEQPTDDPCPFTQPCPFHDAMIAAADENEDK